MKKAKIRRRILSFLLAVCMMIPCFSVQSYATENTEPSNEVATCTCVEKCAEDSINEYCDVCGVDYNGCTGEDVAVVYENESEPAEEVEEEPATEENGEDEVLEAAAVAEPIEGNEGAVDNGTVTVEEQGEVQPYTVSATSFLLNGESSVAKVANVAMTPSNGTVTQGTKVTVTTQDVLGCKFVGWYMFENVISDNITKDMIAEATQKDPKSSSFSYTYEANANVTLVAVYNPAENASATVNVKGGSFTVSVNGEVESEPMSSYTHAWPIGAEVTISAKENRFLYWQNEYGKIVTGAKQYTFTVTGNVELSMCMNGTSSKVVVEFLSDSGQVIYRTECTKDSVGSIKFPGVPAKPGYKDAEWNKTKQEIYQAIIDGATYVKVEPDYTNKTNECYVKVIVVAGGEELGATDEFRVSQGESVTFEADTFTEAVKNKLTEEAKAKLTGKDFLYWMDGSGNILGYKTSYSTILKRNKNGETVTFKAVYGDEEVVARPAIAVTSVYTMEANEKKYLAVSVTRDIPEGYTLVEHGVLASTTFKNATNDNFVLGANGVKKVTSTSKLSAGVYTLTVNRTGKEGDPVVARGYLIVKKGDNKEEIYYTDVEDYIYNGVYADIYGCSHVYQYTSDGDEGHTKSCTNPECNDVVKESHNLVYSVSDATINVTCKQKCGYVGSVTLTVADSNCGDTNTTTVTKTGVWKNDDTNVSVEYKAKNSMSNVNPIAELPANAGTYIASVTVKDNGNVIATVSDEFTIKHYDNGGDGKCDATNCNRVLEYIITVKASLVDGNGDTIKEDVASVSTNPKSGKVIPGEAVTVTAPNVLDYDFLGWYLFDKEDDTYEWKNGSYRYTYVPEDDDTLIAKYEEKAELANIAFDGTNYEVSATYKNKEYDVVLENGTASLPIGAIVTITVTEPDDFVNWTNQYGKVVTTATKYQFTVTGSETFTMTKVSKNQTLVEYVSDYNQVIESQTYTYTYNEAEGKGTISPEVTQPATGPYKKGYDFEKWNLTVAQITEQIEKNVNYIKVTPIYEWNPAGFDVTVYVNGVENAELSEVDFPEGTIKTVEAPEVDNRKFQYWTDGEGTILGYNKTYSIKITKDTILKAVYVKKDVEVVAKPTIVMTDVYPVDNNGTKQISFMVTRDVPKGTYTLVEHGILIGAPTEAITEDKEDTFVIGATGVKKTPSSATEYSGVFTTSLGIGTKVDHNVSARGYLIVKVGDQEEIYYTDVVNCTYNALASVKQEQ